MIYDIEYETMPKEALKAIQLQRLKTTLERVYATVPFYRNRFEDTGISPTDIKSLEDLKSIPFTTKQDLRENYPYGMFAVPMNTAYPSRSKPGRKESHPRKSLTSITG